MAEYFSDATYPKVSIYFSLVPGNRIQQEKYFKKSSFTFEYFECLWNMHRHNGT